MKATFNRRQTCVALVGASTTLSAQAIYLPPLIIPSLILGVLGWISSASASASQRDGELLGHKLAYLTRRAEIAAEQGLWEESKFLYAKAEMLLDGKFGGDSRFAINRDGDVEVSRNQVGGSVNGAELTALKPTLSDGRAPAPVSSYLRHLPDSEWDRVVGDAAARGGFGTQESFTEAYSPVAVRAFSRARNGKATDAVVLAVDRRQEHRDQAGRARRGVFGFHAQLAKA